ncbi:hypothetical protein EGW08_011896, partial [Elysia chlorotica]
TFPIKAPETLTELICWKRYNDFKTLYKSLSSLHKALHRRDAFPEFAKPKLFGRFDDDVIEERRQSAAALLNFVSTQPHLYKSLVFKQFLEDGKSPTNINPKGLDILVAAGSSHSRSDGYPPPDLVPYSAESCSRTSESIEKVGEGLITPCPDGVDEEDCSSQTSPATLMPTSAKNQRDVAIDSTSISHSKSNDLTVLEGTWNYPAVADNISLNSSNGKDTTDTDDEVNDIGDYDVEEDSAVATSLPDTDLAFFDPISHDALAVQPHVESGGGIPRSNSWLLKGLNMCAEMETNESTAEGGDENFCNSGEQTVMSVGSTVTDGSEQITSASDKTSSVELSSEFEFIRTMSQSSDGSKVECGKGDVDLSSEWQTRSGSFVGLAAAATFGSGPVIDGGGKEQRLQSGDCAVDFGKQKLSRPSSRSHSAISEKLQDLGKAASSAESSSSNKSPSRSASSNLLRRLVSGVTSNKGASQASAISQGKPRSPTEHSVSSVDLGGKEDYIYLAASQICMAQNSEVNGDFEVAFAYYKSGVGILLQGVQSDTNKTRRDAVRRKTAQYLMKAEDLFNRHLATETVDERRWGAESFLSPSLDLDPSFAFIRGSTRELRNFQVLGTIDRVVLVRDKGTDETFVIKSIPKSTPDTERTQSILPTTCPHMVSLHRFFETDSCVFLLLQYASGGKLWTYIGDYLHSDRINAGIDLSVTKDHSQAQNIYSGTKVESGTLSSDAAVGGVESLKGGEGNESKYNMDDHDTMVNNSDHLGAVRFSDLQKRKDSTGIGSGETLISSSACQVQDKNWNNSARVDAELNPENATIEMPRKESINEVEGQDQFNDSGLVSVPKPASKVALNRRLSNLSDDVYTAVPSDEAPSPATNELEAEEPEEEGHFRKLLVETHHNIEDFSINSFDSGDVPVRLNSSSSSCVDRIPSIPEDADTTQSKIGTIPESESVSAESNDRLEDQVFFASKDTEHGEFVGEGIRENSFRKTLVSQQISADQVSSSSYFAKETEDLNRGAKKRHSSVDELSSQENHHSVAIYAPTFNSDDLIRCSKDLLKHVDSVLSETGSDVSSPEPATIEVFSVSSQQHSEVGTIGGCSVDKQPYESSQESSAEEPSIYDLNRSSDEDLDESGKIEQKNALNSSPTENSVTTSDTILDTSSNPPSDSKSKRVLKSYHPWVNTEKDRVSSMHHHSNKTNGNSTSRLSLSCLDSKELTRSASFECDLKSPTRNRARTIAAVFERLDSTPADHIRIPESSIRKWMAQMVTAVSRLHSLGIVCRDLKPSNILLGEKGQVMLTYFCHLGYGDQELDWEAVDNIYAAPEVSSINGYDKACDWWSIGALLFELLVGETLIECHPGGITSHTCLFIPAFVSDEARSLLEGLLKHNPNERLGSGIAGAEEIKAHPFFSGIDWHGLEYS